HIRIYFTSVVFKCNSFSPSGHTHIGSIEIPYVFFKRSTVSTGLFLFAIYGKPSVQALHTESKSIGRLPHSTPVLNMVSAGEIEEHTSELQSRENLVCRQLLDK